MLKHKRTKTILFEMYRRGSSCLSSTSIYGVAVAKQPTFSLASFKSHCDVLNVRLVRFDLARLKFDYFAAATKK